MRASDSLHKLIGSLYAKKHAREKMRVQRSRIFVYEFMIAYNSGTLEDIISSMHDAEQFLKEDPGMPDSFNDELTYNLAYYNFISEDYLKAQKYIEELIANKSHKVSPAIQKTSRILNLVLHFDQGHYDYLESLIRSVYHFLSSRKQKYRFEMQMIQFLRKALKMKNENELQKLYIETRKEFIQLSEEKYEQEAFDFFDVIKWLTSKIEKKSYAKVIEEMKRK
jgi:hypothetical protein